MANNKSKCHALRMGKDQEDLGVTKGCLGEVYWNQTVRNILGYEFNFFLLLLDGHIRKNVRVVYAFLVNIRITFRIMNV